MATLDKRDRYIFLTINASILLFSLLGIILASCIYKPDIYYHSSTARDTRLDRVVFYSHDERSYIIGPFLAIAFVSMSMSVLLFKLPSVYLTESASQIYAASLFTDFICWSQSGKFFVLGWVPGCHLFMCCLIIVAIILSLIKLRKINVWRFNFCYIIALSPASLLNAFKLIPIVAVFFTRQSHSDQSKLMLLKGRNTNLNLSGYVTLFAMLLFALIFSIESTVVGIVGRKDANWVILSHCAVSVLATVEGIICSSGVLNPAQFSVADIGYTYILCFTALGFFQAWLSWWAPKLMYTPMFNFSRRFLARIQMSGSYSSNEEPVSNFARDDPSVADVEDNEAYPKDGDSNPVMPNPIEEQDQLGLMNAPRDIQQNDQSGVDVNNPIGTLGSKFMLAKFVLEIISLFIGFAVIYLFFIDMNSNQNPIEYIYSYHGSCEKYFDNLLHNNSYADRNYTTYESDYRSMQYGPFLNETERDYQLRWQLIHYHANKKQFNLPDIMKEHCSAYPLPNVLAFAAIVVLYAHLLVAVPFADYKKRARASKMQITLDAFPCIIVLVTIIICFGYSLHRFLTSVIFPVCITFILLTATLKFMDLWELRKDTKHQFTENTAYVSMG